MAEEQKQNNVPDMKQSLKQDRKENVTQSRRESVKQKQSTKQNRKESETQSRRESIKKNQSTKQNRKENTTQSTKQSKKQNKMQYHPPECASLELEFRQNEKQLIYKSEHILNSKPNQIDLLIEKTDDSVIPESRLGTIFKRYNIIEFKSPKDKLNERVYYRTVAYAYLLAAYDKAVVSLDEITLTFIRQSKPVKLIRRFKEWGFEITEYEHGIYHVSKSGHMDMQIIVTIELGREYKWITKLTDRVELEDILAMLSEIEKLEGDKDLLNAESVFDLMVKLNLDKEWMKEVNGMGAFRDLFKEEFEKKDQTIAEQNERISEQDERISELNEQLQSKDEQLQSKDEQLQSKKEEVSKLKEELEQLKKQMGKIAMF